MKMSRSEAGKLGRAASRATQDKLYQERIAKYEENPIPCKECSGPISYKSKQYGNAFCCSSCSATYNNRHREYGKLKNKCIDCGTNVTKKSVRCRSCHHKQRKITDVELVKCDGRRRRLLISQNGAICEVCKNTKWMGIDIPLELDHIDGDHRNNSKSNLRIICPNCHAQTPTYKGKNKGRGRPLRMIRYHAAEA